ncbi:hypothetical protein EJ02DRAFT_63068 [Clathrospora elynae]|uniref:Uncharacterized protein n=1 Tax=Clathrospora elynae TaxID=706981 RepID=A0A6A5SCB5_9PLEO|nr:hypothetical protein EJ02DRAFT_63068 [Clathrospora elynae]
MSWSGPVAGAAPFQQQPYANGQLTYSQQPPYQYGQQPAYGQYQPGATYPPAGQPQRPPNVQPPKKKGNPIITRYPPPPGYRGPAQPQAHFGTNTFPNQYQPPQPGFSQAPAVPPAYPQQGYTAPPAHKGFPSQGYSQPQPQPQAPTYQQPSYPQGQNNYQWPQQAYPPNTGYSQPSSHPPVQDYAPPQNSYQGYAPQSAAVDPNQQAYGQTPGWPQQSGPAQYPPNQYNNLGVLSVNARPMLDPNATPTPATAHLATSYPTSLSNQPTSAVSEASSNEKPQLFLAWDDWDFDFEGAIWPKSNEPVDPALSLGVIVWHPAKQMTRALPSTFAEAEEEALQPTPEKLDNGDSVSMYFTAENSHEAFLDVRQTNEWETIQDDPVFVVFTHDEMKNHLVSLEDCIAQRDRPDEFQEDLRRDRDLEMRDATWDIMDNLEQALTGINGAAKPAVMKQEPASPQFNQDDILARLGVTGAPKPPSDEPISMSFSVSDMKPSAPLSEKPSVAPPSARIPDPLPLVQRALSYGGHHNNGHGPAPPRPYDSMSSSTNSRPPPPPPPPEEYRFDPWNAPQRNVHGYGGSRGSPALSEGSNRTMVGSDFEPETPNCVAQQDAPVVPSLSRSDSTFSRKRSYEDADQENERLRQQDDHSKRKRRSQVDAAYSRR